MIGRRGSRRRPKLRYAGPSAPIWQPRVGHSVNIRRMLSYVEGPSSFKLANKSAAAPLRGASSPLHLRSIVFVFVHRVSPVQLVLRFLETCFSVSLHFAPILFRDFLRPPRYPGYRTTRGFVPSRAVIIYFTSVPPFVDAFLAETFARTMADTGRDLCPIFYISCSCFTDS